MGGRPREVEDSQAVTSVTPQSRTEFASSLGLCDNESSSLVSAGLVVVVESFSLFLLLPFEALFLFFDKEVVSGAYRFVIFPPLLLLLLLLLLMELLVLEETLFAAAGL